jgi:hypothetical protein
MLEFCDAEGRWLRILLDVVSSDVILRIAMAEIDAYRKEMTRRAMTSRLRLMNPQTYKP